MQGWFARHIRRAANWESGLPAQCGPPVIIPDGVELIHLCGLATQLACDGGFARTIQPQQDGEQSLRLNIRGIRMTCTLVEAAIQYPGDESDDMILSRRLLLRETQLRHEPRAHVGQSNFAT